MATVAEWLIDQLDAELAVRRRELIDLRLLTATTSGARNATLSRTCVVMAYAHWEGFTKRALRLYFDHLVKLRLKLVDLKYELQTVALSARMKSVADTAKSIADKCTLLKYLDNRSSEIFVIDSKEIVRVGNLTSDNLKILLEFAALEYRPSYATRENFIDSVVCGGRHLIAHGELYPVSASDARYIASAVLTLCDEINDQIQTAAVYREYFI